MVTVFMVTWFADSKKMKVANSRHLRQTILTVHSTLQNKPQFDSMDVKGDDWWDLWFQEHWRIYVANAKRLMPHDLYVFTIQKKAENISTGLKRLE